MSLANLMEQRRAKIAAWKAIGCEPYAYRFDVTHHAADVLARGDAVTDQPGEPVAVAGRLVSRRGHGKAGFGHVLDGSGRLQVYFRSDVLGEQFARYEEWGRGAGFAHVASGPYVRSSYFAEQVLAGALRLDGPPRPA